jgi:hypothetical protein
MQDTIVVDALYNYVEVIMKKRTISFVLILSLSFSIGCYNNQTITKEELTPTTKGKLNAEGEQRDITVLMKDSREYQFSKENYRIQGDTLTGFGVQKINDNEGPFHGSIALADITSLKTTEFSLTKTLLAIGFPVAVVGAWFIAFAAGMSRR